MRIPSWLKFAGMVIFKFVLIGYFWFFTGMSGWLAVLIPNAISGIAIHHLMWQYIARYLIPDEARDKNFPAFRRYDNHRWSYAIFVPGALTVMLWRAYLGAGSLFWLVVWLKVVMIGHKWGKNPLTGFRLWANWFGYMCCTGTIVTASFVRMKKHNVVHCDYSEYLGPDYLKTQQLPKKASTIVSNHSSWLDSLILIFNCYPGFAAKIETKKIPILRECIQNLQSIYISRGGTDKQRADNLNEILERQKLVEEDPRYPQICIYPEGTQTNGTHLLSFKKGAFLGMRAVQPVILKYRWKNFSPTWEGMPFLSHCMMQFALFRWFVCDVYILPAFKPNDYLLEKHADKGSEPWEIFAWAVREVMAREGDFKLTSQTNGDKIAYKDFMTGKKDELTWG